MPAPPLNLSINHCLTVNERLFAWGNKEIHVVAEPVLVPGLADDEPAEPSRWWWVFVVGGSLLGWAAIILAASAALGF